MFKDQKNKRIGRVRPMLCALLSLIFVLSAFTLGTSALQTKRGFSGDSVYLGGVPFGVKFTTEGVMVIGFSEIDEIPKNQSPAYLAGIRIKDVITKINGKSIASADELTQSVESSGGSQISLTYKRMGEEKTVSMTPIFSENEKRYKTGIWVKDSGAGIGTVTYILPDTLEFGGLGHGICDSDNGELIKMSRGDVMNVTVYDIKKGVSGTPGELKGHFGSSKTGVLRANTECGVFGSLVSIPEGCREKISVAGRDQIREGEAFIVCTLDGGAKAEYKIDISAVNRSANGPKCFMIKVKDQALIEKTGGIVQGMSGSPIIQDGKLIGAVTHVMINDSTVGYGIFIENMLVAMTE